MTIHRFGLALAVAAAAIALIGCGGGSGGDGGSGKAGGGSGKVAGGGTGGSFTDPRDEQKYRTVKIGGLTWMAENLNYKSEASWCYGDDESNCAKYGRLYDWQSANAACPGGWRLPTRDEWNKVVEATVDQRIAGKKLKSKSGWERCDKDGGACVEDGNGTDDYGFSALPGGFRTYGRFNNAGYIGRWWSATENGAENAYDRHIDYNYDYAGESNVIKKLDFSVRCVARE